MTAAVPDVTVAAVVMPRVPSVIAAPVMPLAVVVVVMPRGDDRLLLVSRCDGR